MNNFTNQKTRFAHLRDFVREYPSINCNTIEEVDALFYEFESVRLSTRAQYLVKLLRYYQAIGMSESDISFYLDQLRKKTDLELCNEYQHVMAVITINSLWRGGKVCD